MSRQFRARHSDHSESCNRKFLFYYHGGTGAVTSRLTQ